MPQDDAEPYSPLFSSEVTDSGDFQLWREAMTQIRHLHEAVWRAVTFFFTINTIAFAGITHLIVEYGKKEGTWGTGLALVGITILGAFLSRGSLHVFESHREKYVRMMGIKTLLEDRMGFYRARPFKSFNSNESLSFEWSVKKIELFRENRDEWARDYLLGEGTSTRTLWVMFRGFRYIYTLLAFVFLTWFCCRTFGSPM